MVQKINNETIAVSFDEKTRSLLKEARGLIHQRVEYRMPGLEKPKEATVVSVKVYNNGNILCCMHNGDEPHIKSVRQLVAVYHQPEVEAA